MIPRHTSNLDRSLVDPLFPLYLFPPARLAALLVGLIHGSFFFIVAGRRLASLPLYLTVSTFAALIAQEIATGWPLPPGPLALGDCNLLAVSAGAWLTLVTTRAFRA